MSRPPSYPFRPAPRNGHDILLRLILVGGAGLAAILVVTFLLLRFGNRLTRELTGFNSSVRSLAEERLPSLVRRLSLGQDVDVAAEAPPLTLRTSTLEVARIADGFAAVQRTAVGAAVGQAEPRKASATSSAASLAGTSPCCSGSCGRWSRWSAGPRTRTRWLSCSGWTT